MRYTTLGPIATLALALIACDRSPPPAESLDRRTAVSLPPEPLEAVHAEMRTMLTSLHQIHLGLANRDTGAIRQAAVASGVANAEDPELEHLLPAEFLRLAVETHSGFDRLADGVGRGQPRDSGRASVTHYIGLYGMSRDLPAGAGPAGANAMTRAISRVFGNLRESWYR